MADSSLFENGAQQFTTVVRALRIMGSDRKAWLASNPEHPSRQTLNPETPKIKELARDNTLSSRPTEVPSTPVAHPFRRAGFQRASK